MQFSGSAPVLEWFAGDEEKLDGDDENEPRTAQNSVMRAVTIDDDQRPFRCVTRLGEKQQVCQVVVQVPRLCSPLLLCIRDQLVRKESETAHFQEAWNSLAEPERHRSCFQAPAKHIFVRTARYISVPIALGDVCW